MHFELQEAIDTEGRDCYELLADAIIRQAVEDYRFVTAHLVRLFTKYPSFSNRHYQKTINCYHDIMKFFAVGGDFEILNYDDSIHIDRVLQRIDEETQFDNLRERYEANKLRSNYAIKFNWKLPVVDDRDISHSKTKKRKSSRSYTADWDYAAKEEYYVNHVQGNNV